MWNLELTHLNTENKYFSVNNAAHSSLKSRANLALARLCVSFPLLWLTLVVICLFPLQGRTVALGEAPVRLSATGAAAQRHRPAEANVQLAVRVPGAGARRPGHAAESGSAVDALAPARLHAHVRKR